MLARLPERLEARGTSRERTDQGNAAAKLVGAAGVPLMFGLRWIVGTATAFAVAAAPVLVLIVVMLAS